MSGSVFSSLLGGNDAFVDRMLDFGEFVGCDSKDSRAFRACMEGKDSKELLDGILGWMVNGKVSK